MKFDIKKSLLQAEKHCLRAGVKLTEKRKNILHILLLAEKPLSAYDIADKYKEVFQDSLAVMSVYRMLDFLMAEQLAHKLDTTNQYIACSHIACEHRHEEPQFLICDNCKAVSEVGIKVELLDALRKNLSSTGFQLSNQQLELHGLCEKCSESH